MYILKSVREDREEEALITQLVHVRPMKTAKQATFRLSTFDF